VSNPRVPAKKKPSTRPPTSAERVKEACACIRRARVLWDAHNNAACRGERAKALALYEALSPDERKQIPEQLLVWLRYRSEKYFGDHTTPPGGGRAAR
jgi:hypothetical protein